MKITKCEGCETIESYKNIRYQHRFDKILCDDCYELEQSNLEDAFDEEVTQNDLYHWGKI